MAYIGRQLARGENKLFDDISSSFNGSTTAFNLTVSSVATATATPYQLFVSLGGVMQKPNTDFTTAGNQITFTTAPAAGLSCWIMMQGDTIDNAAVADASITPSKISGSNFAFSGDLRLKDADGSHYVGFASPTTVTTNKVWTLPAADGSNGDFLKTNGSAVLSWGSVDTSTLMPLAGGIFTGDVTFDGATAGRDILWDKSADALIFNDNAKAIFGSSSDGIEIYHNASNSVINDAGTGDLLLQVGGSTKATVSSTGFGVTGALTVSTNATISGNLTVSGTTTTVDSVTLSVKDKNIEMGVVSSPSDTTADGGGITLKGASDKTLNWVNATDAWTSSEHIHLIDNKKLFVGGASGTTDGLEIVHNGSNSILNDSGTGTLQLQLGGSTKLEVTSGGINVTGAISVGGSPLASGNTVDLVADGAIAAGKPCIIKSNGKAEQVKVVSSSKANAPAGTINAYTSSDTKFLSLAWSSTSNVLAANRKVVTGTYSGVNIVEPTAVLGNGSISVAGGHNYDTSNGFDSDVCWDPDSDKFIFAWRDGGSSSVGKAVVATESSTSVSFGTTVTFEGGGADTYKIAYDTSNNKVVITFRDYSDSDTVKAIVGTVSGTSISFGTAVSTGMLCGNGVNHLDICFDSNSNKIIICTSKSNSANNQLAVAVGTVSGTGISFGTPVEYGTSSDEIHYPKCTFDSNVNKVVFSYKLVSSGVGHAVVGTVSGTSISFGTAVAFPSNATTHGQDICFDPATNNFFIWFCRANNSDHATILKGAVSGTSVTWADSGGSGAYNTQTNTNYHQDNARWSITPIYTGKLAAICSYSSGHAKILIFSTQTGATNVTSHNCIGFAPSAISDTNTGTINLAGNTVDNQSGLTAGTRYWVADDGTLATSAVTTQAGGVALSSSKLLIHLIGA